MAVQTRVQEALDETDRQVLSILQAKARTSNAEIARQVGKASSAIYERIRKLEERGIVEGYEARIRAEDLGMELLAFVLISKQCRKQSARPEMELAETPGVQEVHVIAGEYCYLVKVRAAGMEQLHDIINERIPSIEGVDATQTIIVLKTVKETAQLPIGEVAAFALTGPPS